MLNEDLLNYILQSRASGLNDEIIRSALLASGWQADQVEEGLNYNHLEALLEPAKTDNRKRPKLKNIVFAFIGIFVLLGFSLALAENGYWRAFSKFYRKTYLPNLWHGTNADVKKTFAAVLAAQTNLKTSSNQNLIINLNVSKLDPGKATSFTLNNISDSLKLASGTPQIFGSLQDKGRSLASVSTPDPTLNMILPLNIGLDSTEKIDSHKNTESSMSLDLSGFDKYFPGVKGTTKSVLNLDAIRIEAAKKYFLKSNIFPNLKSNNGKVWYSIDLPDELLDSIMTGYDLKFDDEETKIWNDMSGIIFTDCGIVRFNGHPAACYRLYLDKQVYQKISENPEFKLNKNDLEAIKKDTPVIDVKFYIDSKQKLITGFEGSLKYPSSSANLVLSVNASFKAEYGTQAEIKAPDSKIVNQGTAWQQDMENIFEKYIKGESIDDKNWFGNSQLALGLRNKFTALNGDLDSSRIKANNAVRKSDISELGKALEVYKNDDNNPEGNVPSTNGVTQCLTDPSNALLQDVAFNKLINVAATHDPEPDKNCYTYTSDGKNYTLETKILDDYNLAGFVVSNGESHDVSMTH